MKTVPFTEAKAKLSALIDAVESGETIDISRHGKTVARLVPPEASDRERARRAVGQLRALRKTLPKTGITLEEILAWRHEGHRY